MQLPAFAQLEQRLNGAVQQHLSNAVVSLGALQLPCTHDVQLPGDSPYTSVATDIPVELTSQAPGTKAGGAK